MPFGTCPFRTKGPGPNHLIALRSGCDACGIGDPVDELSIEHCLQVLEDGWVGHLGVVSEGEPYVAPISYVVVDGQVCFKTGPGRRAEAIRSSPRVCLETSHVDHSTGYWESVVVWGNAGEITDDLHAQTVISALVSKYRPVLAHRCRRDLTMWVWPSRTSSSRCLSRPSPAEARVASFTSRPVPDVYDILDHGFSDQCPGIRLDTRAHRRCR